MIAHILHEGGSTAQGFGDEGRRGGYAGRLFYHYYEYGERLLAGAAPPSDIAYIYTHCNGLIGNMPIRLAGNLQNDIDKAKLFQETRARLVATIAIGGSLDKRAEKIGRSHCLALWERSLIDIKNRCMSENIDTTYIGTPFPADEALARGKPIDTDLRDSQFEIAQQVLPNMVTFESLVGASEDCSQYVDQSPLYAGQHPNAAGYDKITRFLVSVLDGQLGVSSGAYGISS